MIEQNPMNRIIQRYAENANYIFNYLFSMKEISFSDALIKRQETDIFGFKKSMVALTNYGKIITFSSLNGKIIWKSNYYKE